MSADAFTRLPAGTLGVRNDDRCTHIERINPTAPGESLASCPGASVYVDRTATPPKRKGKRRPYKLLRTAFVGGAIRQAGETVWIYPDEVGPHHEPLPLPRGPKGRFLPPPP